MTERKYDSSRRVEAAERTRQQILDAAFKLHGLGITDFESLAKEANVSLATVRKNFPTRESMFQSCTAWGDRYTAMPDFDLIASVDDPAARTRLVVRQAYAFHESLFGQQWHAITYAEESAAVREAGERIQALLDMLAALVIEPWDIPAEHLPEARGAVAGMLSYLTYRAFRMHGGFSAEQAAEQVSMLLVISLSAAAVGAKEVVNAQTSLA